MDYGMPRADNMPSVESELEEVPCKTNRSGSRASASPHHRRAADRDQCHHRCAPSSASPSIECRHAGPAWETITKAKGNGGAAARA